MFLVPGIVRRHLKLNFSTALKGLTPRKKKLTLGFGKKAWGSLRSSFG